MKSREKKTEGERKNATKKSKESQKEIDKEKKSQKKSCFKAKKKEGVCSQTSIKRCFCDHLELECGENRMGPKVLLQQRSDAALEAFVP